MNIVTRRPAKLISLRESRTVSVVLNLANRNCAGTVAYLESQAEKFGFTLVYLLINPTKVELPQWALRDNMTVLNYKKDFSGACRFLTGTAEKFWSQETDYLIAVTDSQLKVIDEIAARSAANFKIGRSSASGENIYDLTVSISWKEKRENLAELLLSRLKVLTRETE